MCGKGFTLQRYTAVMDEVNIVLVTVDCLRYDRCGFNGYYRNTTPVLDSLAKNSFVFDNAYATGPYTPESLPGILAALHSYNSAYYDQPAWKAIPKNVPTLATYLKDHNYRTFATVSNPHLIKERNFDRGFENFNNIVSQVRKKANDEGDTGSLLDLFLINRRGQLRERMRNHSRLPKYYTLPYIALRYYQYHTSWPSKNAESIIKKFVPQFDESNQPFFAWTHLMDLHAPINPDVFRKSNLDSMPSKYSQFKWDANRASNIFDPNYEILYDNALRYVDSQIGVLTRELEEMGIMDNTILIITADHGEALYDRNRYGHERHDLYDELLKVPLLIFAPSKMGQRISHIFSLAWMHELISELLEIDVGNFEASSNRKTHLEDSKMDDFVVSDSLDSDRHTVAVRDSKYKYIRSTGDGSKDELYNYYKDKKERIPIDTNSVSDELRDLATEIETSSSQLESIEGEYTEKTEKRLRELGYKA